MRRAVRIAGSLLVGVGGLALVWVLVVWLWQDPFTAAYTSWQQHRLNAQYEQLVDRMHPRNVSHPLHGNRRTRIAAEKRAVEQEAAALQRAALPGQAIGRIVIPRLGLRMIVVDGTDEASLKRGPGLDRQTSMPGRGRLVYIAGHRTTYLAPFSHIEDIVPGDRITLEMPYATFVYRAYDHQIVPADDLAMLRSTGRELLRLQACHPRFFATHRYIVDAHLVSVKPRGAPGWKIASPASTDRNGA
jgi:sortase A